MVASAFFLLAVGLDHSKSSTVKKLIECAIERQDDEAREKIQAILESQGDQVSLQLHKNCYCSYTSKYHNRKLESRKRKADSIDVNEAPPARVRRSQVKEFDFKKHCLFCAKACEHINPKHPDRWDKVIQCERVSKMLLLLRLLY